MAEGRNKKDWRDSNWYISATGFWREYSKHKIGLIGLSILVVYVCVAIFAPYLVQYDPSPSNRVGPSFLAPGWMQVFDPDGVVTSQVIGDERFGTEAGVVEFGTSDQFSTSYHPGEAQGDFSYQNLTWIHGANESIQFREPYDVMRNLPDTLDFIYLYREFDWAKNRLPSDANTTLEVSVTLTGGFRSDPLGGLKFKIYIWLIDSSGDWRKIYESYPPYSEAYQQRRIDLSYFDLIEAWGGMIEDPTGTQEDPDDVLRFAVGLAPTRHMRNTLYLDGSVTVSIRRISMVVYGDYFGILGTTDKGADAWSQLVYGSRVSLLIGTVATALSSTVGVIVGMVSGYFGGKVDEVMMRIVDFLLVIPGLPLMMVLAAFLGPTIGNIILVISILGWTGTSRLIRSQVMAEKNKAYVESARAIGASDTYIIFRHIFPNVTPILFADITLGVVGAILSESGLAFLGLTSPSEPSWGRMLADAQGSGGFSNGAWWCVIFPGLMITTMSLAFTFVGHTLDQVLNPRLRER